MITHATPQARDLVYDQQTEHAMLPLQLHHDDGRTQTTVLFLDGEETQRVSVQLDIAIDQRATADHAVSLMRGVLERRTPGAG